MKKSEMFQVLRDVPLMTNPLAFFNVDRKIRVFLNISDNEARWKRDMIVAEKLFADVIVAPFGHEITTQIAEVKEILEKRTNLPGVKEDPAKLELAKTWVLSRKVHEGPRAETFLAPTPTPMTDALNAICEKQIDNFDHTIQCVKIDIAQGLERRFVYQLLEENYRPGILIVRWTEDIDDHFATANCVGHLINCGYQHVYHEHSYSIFVFANQPLYDICSLKQTGLNNPMMDTIIQNLLESIKPIPMNTSTDSSTVPST